MSATTKAGLPRRRVSPGAPLSERIELHTDRSGEHWIWTGAIDKTSGYGRISVAGKVGYAHRVAYEAFVGPIPPGRELDHLCRVRSCCKPDHLEPVTPQVNVRRGMSPGAVALRREMCFHGQHTYEEFGYVDAAGRRKCHACFLTYLRIWRSTSPKERGERKLAGLPIVDLAAFYAERSVAA